MCAEQHLRISFPLKMKNSYHQTTSNFAQAHHLSLAPKVFLLSILRTLIIVVFFLEVRGKFQ